MYEQVPNNQSVAQSVVLKVEYNLVRLAMNRIVDQGRLRFAQWQYTALCVCAAYLTDRVFSYGSRGTTGDCTVVHNYIRRQYRTKSWGDWRLIYTQQDVY